jgi:hypothetical protein
VGLEQARKGEGIGDPPGPPHILSSGAQATREQPQTTSWRSAACNRAPSLPLLPFALLPLPNPLAKEKPHLHS